MNIFVTAGNTQTPVDRVRCITNIFSGKTGARIAVEAFGRGHTVTLATSHPEVLDNLPSNGPRTEPNFVVKPYRTYDDLEAIMASEIGSGRYDAVIHASAVNDYYVAGVYGLLPGTTFDGTTHHFGEPAQFVPATGGKIKGNHSELWIRMTPAPKLVDKIREPWGFTGTLVKFKLEVGLSEPELIAVGEQARTHSRANWLVANTLEGMHEWAYLLGEKTKPRKLNRNDLAKQLIQAMDNDT
jgi:phosphopantothenoylcysteine synthetase/decarboxylase